MRGVFASVTATAVLLTAGAAAANDPRQDPRPLVRTSPEVQVDQVCQALKRQRGVICNDDQRAELLQHLRERETPRPLTPRRPRGH